MNLSFKDKVALVIGAGSGMGLAAAQAFAAEGAAVALVDTNESAVRTAAEKLAASGHKAIAVRCEANHRDEPSRASADARPRVRRDRHRDQAWR
jgi:NAD(P)-dependent dehydrogenase (short-subunit alcohol dehydrogenase family)